VAVCCERGDEPLASVKCEETANWLKASEILEIGSVVWSWLEC